MYYHIVIIWDLRLNVPKICSDGKHWKLPFSTTPWSFDAPLQKSPATICIILILPETIESMDQIFAAATVVCLYSNIRGILGKTYVLWNSAWAIHFRVIQGPWFRYQSKARTPYVTSYLRSISNLSPILHCFRDTAGFLLKTATYFNHNLGMFPLNRRCWGAEERRP